MKKRFFAIFIVVIMLLSQMTIFASALDSNSTVTNPQDKLTDELKEVMSDTADDEYIPIYIFLNELGDEAVYAVLSNELGETITAETESSYIQSQITSKIEKLNKSEAFAKELSLESSRKATTNVETAQMLIKKANISTVMSESEIQTCIEAGMPFEEIIGISEQTQFLSQWRDKREYLNGAINSRFEERLNTKKCRNIYFDQMLSYVQLECEKSYIYALARLSEVKEIGYYTEPKYVLDTIETLEQTENLDYNTGYHMTEKEGISYDAAGIKIGVIEVPDQYKIEDTPILGVYCDDSNVHLSGKTNLQLIENYNFVNSVEGKTTGISKHATTVLSIICGNEATRTDGVKYKGLAPNATVYYVNYNCNQGFQRAIAWCLENNVSVINMSFGSVYGNYSWLDRYADCIIEQYRVSIVKSAGNYKAEKNPTSLVTSPGLAYNVITVGNMNWQTNENGELQLRTSSCFEQETYLANKPDIATYGTDIHLLDASGTPENRTSGTSFAAPMVAATIALMMKENSSLIGNPDAVKSILLTTAHSDNISSDIIENNQNAYLYNVSGTSSVTATPVLRYGSGAGLLNIEGAVATSGTNCLARYAFTEGETVTIGEYYFSQNQKIKLSLVFEKFDFGMMASATDIISDWDIEILNSNGNVIASSWSPFNNVEILECEFVLSGYYSINIVNCGFPTENDLSESYTIYDENGNQTTVNTNEICYVSVLLICDCDVPELSVNCNGGVSHDVACSNCSFVCQEKHSVTTETVEYSDATVEYNVYYRFRNSLEWVGFYDRVCYQIQEPIVTPKNASYVGISIPTGGSSIIQPDKTTIEIRTIQILIINPEDGAVVTSWDATFRVIYDLSTGLYYIIT